jgi:hypothetical protein
LASSFSSATAATVATAAVSLEESCLDWVFCQAVRPAGAK